MLSLRSASPPGSRPCTPKARGVAEFEEARILQFRSLGALGAAERGALEDLAVRTEPSSPNPSHVSVAQLWEGDDGLVPTHLPLTEPRADIDRSEPEPPPSGRGEVAKRRAPPKEPGIFVGALQLMSLGTFMRSSTSSRNPSE